VFEYLLKLSQLFDLLLFAGIRWW